MFRKILATDNDPATLFLRLALGMAVTLLIKGGGRWSVDGALASRSGHNS